MAPTCQSYNILSDVSYWFPCGEPWIYTNFNNIIYSPISRIDQLPSTCRNLCQHYSLLLKRAKFEVGKYSRTFQIFKRSNVRLNNAAAYIILHPR